MRSCEDCGLPQRVPPLQPGTVARCYRCDAVLRRTWTDPLGFALATSAVSLLLLVVGATGTLAVVERAGQQRTADLLAGPAALAGHGLWELSVLVVFTTLVAPVVTTCLLLGTLVGIRARQMPAWVPSAFALRNRLRPWSMTEVFLVGYFVAYAKLGALAHIEPGPAFFALVAFVATTLATDAVVDPQAVWEAMDRRRSTPPGAPPPPAVPAPSVVCCGTCQLACQPEARCPRCHSALHRRKPGGVSRTAALALSSLILYVPANVLPVLTVTQLGRGSPSTILGGVRELAGSGDWLLAAIVFLASIAVPMLKIIGLGSMLLVAVRGRTRHLRRFTVLYRVVSVIGRWSMIDIFMESILSALVRFGDLATIGPGPGAVAFAAVVVLTILAAEGFDPRLMWDKAAR